MELVKAGMMQVSLFLKIDTFVLNKLSTTLPLRNPSISFNLVKGFSKFQSFMAIKTQEEIFVKYHT